MRGQPVETEGDVDLEYPQYPEIREIRLGGFACRKIISLKDAREQADYWAAFRNGRWSDLFPVILGYNTIIAAPRGEKGPWTLRHRRFASGFAALWGQRLFSPTPLPLCTGEAEPSHIQAFLDYKVVAFTTREAARVWLGE